MNATTIPNFANLAGLDQNMLAKLAMEAVERARVVRETQVTHEGKKLILPAEPKPMELQDAIEILKMQAEAANQEYDVNERLDGYPFDAAAAFYRAIQKRYGFVNSVTVQKEGFFGMKYDMKPDMRQIRVGPNPDDIIQVPVGGFKLPGFDQPIETSFYQDRNTGKVWFRVTGTLKAKDRDAIREILAETRRELTENSIYKGRAILLKTNSSGVVSLDIEPEFMQTDKIDPSCLILPHATEALLRDTMWTPILKTARCRQERIPLNRRIILSGPFGTGKTLCAWTTAKFCVAGKQWTYVMVDRPEGLVDALRFARRYQPAVVFAEDIDRVMDERDADANDLLNEIDGALSKDSEVMVVLTTNHLDKIHKAMLRPGRTDAIIPIEAPDADAAERLVRLFAGDLIGEDQPLTKLAVEIQGYIPAVVREIVERSKLGMISRDDTRLTEEDILTAARSMKAHANLLSGKADDDSINAYEKLGRGFAEVMSNGPLTQVHSKLDDIRNCI